MRLHCSLVLWIWVKVLRDRVSDEPWMHPNLLPASPEVSFNTTGLLKILKGRVILALTSIDSVCRKSFLGTSESMSPLFQQRIYCFPCAHSQPPPKSNDLRHVVKNETLFGLKSYFGGVRTRPIEYWKLVCSCFSPPCICIRAVESESLEKSKNRKKSDKIGKIGSDFLSDFLAKVPKCHKLPKCVHFGSGSCIRIS